LIALILHYEVRSLTTGRGRDEDLEAEDGIESKE